MLVPSSRHIHLLLFVVFLVFCCCCSAFPLTGFFSLRFICILECVPLLPNANRSSQLKSTYSFDECFKRPTVNTDKIHFYEQQSIPPRDTHFPFCSFLSVNETMKEIVPWRLSDHRSCTKRLVMLTSGVDGVVGNHQTIKERRYKGKGKPKTHTQRTISAHETNDIEGASSFRWCCSFDWSKLSCFRFDTRAIYYMWAVRFRFERNTEILIILKVSATFHAIHPVKLSLKPTWGKRYSNVIEWNEKKLSSSFEVFVRCMRLRRWR